MSVTWSNAGKAILAAELDEVEAAQNLGESVLSTTDPYEVGQRVQDLIAVAIARDAPTVDRIAAALASMSGMDIDDRVDPGDYQPGLPTVRQFAAILAAKLA